jgi:4-amino-4-deoxy-L-arabinose transferase-like glycosyltransferase
LNLILYNVYGIRRGGDTLRYIKGAENLLQSGALEGKQVAYIGYIGIVALNKLIGTNLNGVVALQVGMATITALTLFYLGNKLCGPLAGIFAAGLFSVNLDIAQWNFYILTDSLYISFVVLSILIVHHATEKKGFWRLLALLVVIATISIRPNGWVLVPVAGSYWITKAEFRNWFRLLALTGLLIVFILGVFFLPNLKASVEAETHNSRLHQGVIIWGYEGQQLSMPKLTMTEASGWKGTLQYIVKYPLASLRLATARVLAALGHVRPFYSIRHNIVIIVYLFPIYVLAVLGLYVVHNRLLLKFILGVILIHLLIVAVTFADWDGRFLLHILPIIGVFSSCGADYLIIKFRTWYHGKYKMP